MPAPETSAALMDQVLARLGGSGRALEFRVFDCYSRSVGATPSNASSAPSRSTGKMLCSQARTAVPSTGPPSPR